MSDAAPARLTHLDEAGRALDAVRERLARVRVIADVLVRSAGKFLLEQELLILAVRHREWTDGIMNDFAALQALGQLLLR